MCVCARALGAEVKRLLVQAGVCCTPGESGGGAHTRMDCGTQIVKDKNLFLYCKNINLNLTLELVNFEKFV